MKYLDSSDRSWWIFERFNPLRRLCSRIAGNRWFSRRAFGSGSGGMHVWQAEHCSQPPRSANPQRLSRACLAAAVAAAAASSMPMRR